MLTIKGIFLGLIGCNIIMSCILESMGALLYFISYWGDVTTFFMLYFSIMAAKDKNNYGQGALILT